VSQPTHTEQHFMASDTVRDIVIGMSDGLTVPFAIAAGMSGAAVGATIILTAGLAEIAAGSISMGLGGYLAGRTDVEHYDAEYKRETQETLDVPDQEAREVEAILRDFGLEEDQVGPVVQALSKDRDRWVDFMMRFELGLERPDPRRAMQSAITIAASYAVSGFIPLAPYVFISPVSTALGVSVLITLAALFVFGYVKGRVTGLNAWTSAIQTMLIGGVAAGAAFLIAQLIG
jgi:VIT1/CCC1 family predicted Fe2+/Mn2+ transporter